MALFSGNAFGRTIREQFEAIDGSSELAMLACPTQEELEQLSRVVAAMTEQQKAAAADLSDEQVHQLALEADADPAIVAIFFNGYALHCKRVP